MKHIINIVNQYAAMLNCAFISMEAEPNEYFTIIKKIFHKAELVRNNPYSVDYKGMDIVFLQVNSESVFNTISKTRDLVAKINEINDLVVICAIKNSVDNIELMKSLEKNYYIDHILPFYSNYDEETIYTFLYRVLKPIVIKKELEEALVYEMSGKRHLELKEAKMMSQKQKDKENANTSSDSIDNDGIIDEARKERLKDVRYTRIEKISAEEFISTLDDGVVDKIEDMRDELSDIIVTLYDMEKMDAKEMYEALQPFAKRMYELHLIIDSLILFQIISKTFYTLYEFLSGITLDDLQDGSKKSMLVTMLLAVMKDLEEWIDVIFIQRNTKDIHYLDASFSSNILQIENLFVSDIENDGSDLDFF